MAKGKEFEQFSQQLNKWYHVFVYSHSKGYFTTMFVDITDKKIYEEKLTRERNLFSAGPVFTIEWDPTEDWPIKSVSPNVTSILGYTPGELLSPDFRYACMIHPDDIKRIANEVLYNIENNIDKFEQSYRLINKSGEYRWFYDFTMLERDEKGNLIGIRGYMFDQTNQKNIELELKREKTRLSHILKGTNVGTWEWNIQTGETVFDSRWAEIIGYSLEEISPVSIETWIKFTHPEDLEVSGELLQKHFTGELEYFEFESRMKHKNGEWVWVLDRGRVASWTEDGKPLMMFGTHQEITELKKVEAALRESDILLNKLSAQLPGVIYLYRYHPDGRHYFPFASDKISSIFGVSPNDVKHDASPIVNRIHPDDRNTVLESITKSFETLEIWEHDYRVILPEVGEKWLRGIAQPEKLEDGSVLWHGYITDITDRKLADLELQKTHEQYALAIKGSNDGIWDWDILTGETYFSPRWKSMIGYAEDEIKNEINVFFSLIQEDDIHYVTRALNDYLSRKIPDYEVEFRMKHKDGTYRWILARGEALRNADGIPFRMAGSHNDITKRKQDENELQKSKEELSHINDNLQASKTIIENSLLQKNELINQLNNIKTELESTIKEKDKFFSIIAHDLKSPFSGFLGLTRLMAENLMDLSIKEVQEYSLNLQESASTLYKLLENLLEWSRMQRGLVSFNPEAIRIKSLIDENCEILKDRIKQKELTIINLLDEYLLVEGDLQMVNTVVRNILSNSVKFTPKNGRIEIGISDVKINGFKTIYIKDTGIGMDEVLLSKLFKVDEKVSRQGTESETSTGLGLILCKEFIEKHGGKIWAESKVGKGSTFMFTIPAYKSEETE